MRIHKRCLPRVDEPVIKVAMPQVPAIGKFLYPPEEGEVLEFVQVDEDHYEYTGCRTHAEVMRVLNGKRHYRERMRKWEAFYKRDPKIA